MPRANGIYLGRLWDDGVAHGEDGEELADDGRRPVARSQVVQQGRVMEPVGVQVYVKCIKWALVLGIVGHTISLEDMTTRKHMGGDGSFGVVAATASP
jgi:hypothetical protein